MNKKDDAARPHCLIFSNLISEFDGVVKDFTSATIYFATMRNGGRRLYDCPPPDANCNMTKVSFGGYFAYPVDFERIFSPVKFVA